MGVDSFVLFRVKPFFCAISCSCVLALILFFMKIKTYVFVSVHAAPIKVNQRRSSRSFFLSFWHIFTSFIPNSYSLWFVFSVSLSSEIAVYKWEISFVSYIFFFLIIRINYFLFVPSLHPSASSQVRYRRILLILPCFFSPRPYLSWNRMRTRSPILTLLHSLSRLITRRWKTNNAWE